MIHSSNLRFEEDSLVMFGHPVLHVSRYEVRGTKSLEGKGLAKHPQGLQRLRVIYHRSGVLQSVEVAVKESDELRRMAG